MDNLTPFLQTAAPIVWGPVMLVLLIGTGLYFTIGLIFFIYTQIPRAFLVSERSRNVRRVRN